MQRNSISTAPLRTCRIWMNASGGIKVETQGPTGMFSTFDIPMDQSGLAVLHEVLKEQRDAKPFELTVGTHAAPVQQDVDKMVADFRRKGKVRAKPFNVLEELELDELDLTGIEL